MPNLYHYTTPSGLEGIVRTRSFWATEYRYLNDRTEFEHGLTFLKEALSANGGKIVANRPDINLTIKENSGSIDKVLVFITSFTRKGDLLSQWRGYNDGSGFSIGVDEDWLRENAKSQYFRLVEVIYDKKSARSAVFDAVDRLTDMLGESDGRDEAKIIRLWWRGLLTACASLKSIHFREESEVRLIRVNVKGDMKAKIRTGKTGLVPYTECFLKSVPKGSLLPKNNSGFCNVYVGPNLNERQIGAVKSLQALHDMDFPVIQSSIPYTSA